MIRLLGFATRIVALLIVLIVLYGAFTAYQVWHYAKVDQAETADAIVVLGAAQYNGVPSPVLKARLDHAVKLYKRKLAPVIVVTGGRVPGDKHTEAGASASYLGDQGVPDSKVLREVQGRNSWESLKAAARFMQARDIHKVILVSDSFHDARIRAMAKDLDLEPLVSPTTTSPIDGAERRPYLIKEVGSLGLGRLIGFDRIAGLERSFATTQ